MVFLTPSQLGSGNANLNWKATWILSELPDLLKHFYRLFHWTFPLPGPYPQYGWDFPEEIPEKIRKDPGNALRAFPGIPVEEYGWDPPSPIIQGIGGFQSISRILSPPVRLGTPPFFRSGSGEGLSELVMEFPAVLRVFLIYQGCSKIGNTNDGKECPCLRGCFKTPRRGRSKFALEGWGSRMAVEDGVVLQKGNLWSVSGWKWWVRGGRLKRTASCGITSLGIRLGIFPDPVVFSCFSSVFFVPFFCQNIFC